MTTIKQSPIKYVIVVAGGSGKRMTSVDSTEKTPPKQFLLLKDLPILMHTIKVFHQFNKDIQIILMLPKGYFGLWNDLCEKYQFTIPHQMVRGGQTRFHSVKNGLKHIKGEGIVAVHDGVRPLVNSTTLKRVFDMAEKRGNAIPVFAPCEALREVRGKKNASVNRSCFYLVQTPQCFEVSLLKKAYQQNHKVEYYDDATVVEATGIKMNLIEGNKENIKITTPADLVIAAALLA